MLIFALVGLGHRPWRASREGAPPWSFRSKLHKFRMHLELDPIYPLEVRGAQPGDVEWVEVPDCSLRRRKKRMAGQRSSDGFFSSSSKCRVSKCSGLFLSTGKGFHPP